MLHTTERWMQIRIKKDSHYKLRERKIGESENNVKKESEDTKNNLNRIVT